MKIVVVSGGFDPIHSGHIDYLYSAKALGDMLVVGVNSDAWLERKKGRAFMPVNERFSIINSLKPVDHTMVFNDDDGSAIDLLENVKRVHPDDEIIFANGGDRTEKNIPEMVVEGVTFKFGVGGEDKKNSSSWILQDFKAAKTERAWGYYRVLHEVGKNVKVKELTVEPNQSLSMQKHFKRQELWFVAEGVASVYTMFNGKKYLNDKFEQNEFLRIFEQEWHQLANEESTPLKVIEIQYGDECIEEDIVRI